MNNTMFVGLDVHKETTAIAYTREKILGFCFVAEWTLL